MKKNIEISYLKILSFEEQQFFFDFLKSFKKNCIIRIVDTMIDDLTFDYIIKLKRKGFLDFDLDQSSLEFKIYLTGLGRAGKSTYESYQRTIRHDN